MDKIVIKKCSKFVGAVEKPETQEQGLIECLDELELIAEGWRATAKFTRSLTPWEKERLERIESLLDCCK